MLLWLTLKLTFQNLGRWTTEQKTMLLLLSLSFNSFYTQTSLEHRNTSSLFPTAAKSNCQKAPKRNSSPAGRAVTCHLLPLAHKSLHKTHLREPFSFCKVKLVVWWLLGPMRCLPPCQLFWSKDQRLEATRHNLPTGCFVTKVLLEHS